MKTDNRREFTQGVKIGIPICLGYLSVSFGFGIMAVQNSIPVWIAPLISLTNLTSAGQVAGVEVIAAGGAFIEMVLTQLLINARYCLMGLSLAENCAGFTRPLRALISYGITDEIFGVASARKEPVTPWYMLGIIIPATAGWVSGTALGAVLGDVLPLRISEAMGIMLYGMFIAVIIPPVREGKRYLAVLLIAAAVSCVIFYGLPFISPGFAIIISACIAAAILAVACPVEMEEDNSTNAKEET